MLHESWIPAYAGMTTFCEVVIGGSTILQFDRDEDNVDKLGLKIKEEQS